MPFMVAVSANAAKDICIDAANIRNVHLFIVILGCRAACGFDAFPVQAAVGGASYSCASPLGNQTRIVAIENLPSCLLGGREIA